MSSDLPETRNTGVFYRSSDDDAFRTGRLQPQPDDDFEGKELFTGVEIDGPTVPRDRHFSETSMTIAPEVVSTHISHQDSYSLNVTHNSHAVELAIEKDKEQERGLRPRGVGTWKGMSKSVRNTLIVVLVFIILALVGILLGVLLGRRHSNSSPAAGDYDILATSKLSALEFQNGDNDTDKSVFFQLSSSLAIMRARWNSTTTGWMFENVSQAMIDGGSSIYPKTGTPLVAVSPDTVNLANLSNFWVDLYFVSLSDMPYQIWSWSTPQTDPSKDELWHQESLQNYQVIFDTGFAKGTQLAAYRDQCAANCSDNSRLLYQGANGDLMLGSSPVQSWQDWNVTDLSVADPPGLPALEMNSSIAMTRYSPGPGPEPSGMRMYYDVSHRLEEYLLINGRWTNGSFEASLGEQNVPPDVSVVTYANESGGSLDMTLLTILFDNGTIAVHWQEVIDGPWKMGLAPPISVTALAVTRALKAYSLSDGRIQEWDIDGSKPTSWTLSSNLTTAKG